MSKNFDQMFDKKKLLRENTRLTRPPRLEGAAKEAMMRTVRKMKKPAVPSRARDAAPA